MVALLDRRKEYLLVGQLGAGIVRALDVRPQEAWKVDGLAADPETQSLLRQQWQQTGLDQLITLDQLEQKFNEDD